MDLPAAVFVAIAVVTCAMGMISLVSSNIERRSYLPGLVFLGLTIAALFIAYMRHGGLFTFHDVMLGFVEIIAWALGR
ncbi:MAG: hypothetical protein AAF701_04955 [Pseudomonadota bacterium]